MKSSDRNWIGNWNLLKVAGILALMAVLLAGCGPASTPAPAATKASASSTITTQPTSPSAPTKSPSSSSPEAQATTSSSAASDATAKLYEAAKKEGEVMGYANGTQQELDQIGAAFMKKYPGIQFKGFPGTSEQIMDKVLTEARAGKPVADVFVRDVFDDLYAYTENGVLDKYVSPEFKNYDPKYIDPQGYWAVGSYFVDLIEYNTNAISKDQAPKSYADELKPEFKGKLGLEASAIPWFTYMLEIMGQDKGMTFMKQLADQKPRLVSGHTNLHKMVVSGEIPVAIYMYNFRPLPDKAAGAPIEWVDPAEKTPTGQNFTAVIKNAPHPNAARLFEDFMLSAEGNEIVKSQGWIPTRNGIDLGDLKSVANVDVLTVSDVSVGKKVNGNDTVFRDLFGKP